MAAAPSFGAGTVVNEPLNYPTVRKENNPSRGRIVDQVCILTLVVGVLEALRMYASRISFLAAEVWENSRVEPELNLRDAPAGVLTADRTREIVMVYEILKTGRKETEAKKGNRWKSRRCVEGGGKILKRITQHQVCSIAYLGDITYPRLVTACGELPPKQTLGSIRSPGDPTINSRD